MAFDAADLDGDLDSIFDDFNDSILVDAVSYPGLYQESYIELNDISMFAPIFTAKVADLGAIAIEKVVAVSSGIYGLAGKAYTVKEKIPNARSVQLVLEDA